MSTALSPVRIADDAFELEVAGASEAQTLASALRDGHLAEDVVAGLNRVTVQFDPEKASEVYDWLKKLEWQTFSMPQDSECLEIEIEYGGPSGPDFKNVCQALQLTQSAFIEMHTSFAYRVDMVGFTPGFAYISGVPNNWDIPRLGSPRPRVPAGSVGLTSGYTGIYSLAGPGGWPLIGHTNADLFKADRENPFLIKPGQTLKFRAV